MNNPKYSVDISATQLDEQGLSVNSGWIKIYTVHPDTREYIGASMEFLPERVGLPASAYSDEPTAPPAGMALRRTTDGKKWESVPDHRGKVAYSKSDRHSQVITFIGDLPEGLTLLQPATDYDVWNGKGWVTDTEMMKRHQIELAQDQLISLQAEANFVMAPLQAAVKHGMASDEEKARLDAWEKYTVLLSRVDVSTAPDIEWPLKPE
ncbi:tail fiber assembly protein [Yersinia ruckeri]|uniref:tail fiber assembly protein n=1 Tax=Yersinia ruckeri TaxID=29486 RepID=UPI002238CC76|nr:tail fiber assembly protein [Yersinia ruckeri]EKN4704961.1 tail fiber assembly protein [Yersinia ruckeri]MCW6544673.1 tail fiber assembly protein [Yersinia ruckeri]MCW6571830.1 tail fiber assembly protein [Yersinia ruckeri]